MNKFNQIWAHLAANWKTTAQSLIGGYLAIFAALTGADFSGVQGFHYAKWFLVSGVIAKALLGVFQSDGQGPTQTVSTTTVSVAGSPVAEVATFPKPIDPKPTAPTK
jgi:hypothetical protein